MSRLPVLSGQEIIKVLKKIGYREIRQSGSHIRLAHFSKKSITVPNYKMVGRGLLRKILKDAEISKEKFEKLIK